MIVVLEGMEGSGKTTLGKQLSSDLGIPLYRPFRTDPKEHWDKDSELKKSLEAIGAKPNTYVEDLYVADMLAGIGGDVILDRSMPSGFAHGIDQNVAPVSAIQGAFRYWLWRLGARSDVFYIHFDVSRDVAAKRVQGRRSAFDEARWNDLEMRLAVCYLECARCFRAIRVDADQPQPVVLKTVMDFVKGK